MKALVSRCFFESCRYDGGTQDNDKVRKIITLLEDHNIEIIRVCPEVLGGLPTPRVPAEIVGSQVITKEGDDVTKEFEVGAQICLDIATENNVSFAIMKESSPSCGTSNIYDGTHSGIKIVGSGITTKVLNEADILVFSEEEYDDICLYIKKNS